MEHRLMYMGITHEIAHVSERSYCALNAHQKEELKRRAKTELPISGMLILITCNRTEIYFESSSPMPYLVREILIRYIQEIHQIKLKRSSFVLFDNTSDTVKHLLYVASGLKSAIIGDRQIITQLRNAYREAMANKQLGTLLERAFQSVFRSHKKIIKESLLQNGSTSAAYLSLKIIRDCFQKQYVKNKNVLLIGAGDMTRDVLKYIKKFELVNVYISNRTEEKASQLANEFKIKTYDWQRVIKNDIESFDAVVSAVSHQKHLIHRIKTYDKKRIWIDLAVPCNIDKSIANRFNIIYDIDDIGKRINDANKLQSRAIPTVKSIIREELNTYLSWLNKYINKDYNQKPYNTNQNHKIQCIVHDHLDLVV